MIIGGDLNENHRTLLHVLGRVVTRPITYRLCLVLHSLLCALDNETLLLIQPYQVQQTLIQISAASRESDVSQVLLLRLRLPIKLDSLRSLADGPASKRRRLVSSNTTLKPTTAPPSLSPTDKNLLPYLTRNQPNLGGSRLAGTTTRPPPHSPPHTPSPHSPLSNPTTTATASLRNQPLLPVGAPNSSRWPRFLSYMSSLPDQYSASAPPSAVSATSFPISNPTDGTPGSNSVTTPAQWVPQVTACPDAYTVPSPASSSQTAPLSLGRSATVSAGPTGPSTTGRRTSFSSASSTGPTVNASWQQSPVEPFPAIQASLPRQHATAPPSGHTGRKRRFNSSIDSSEGGAPPRLAARPGSSPDNAVNLSSSPQASSSRVNSLQHRQNSFTNYVPPRWQPDSEVTHCPICNTMFTFFTRKHHCRKCGRVVCAACSPHRITIPRQFIVSPPSRTRTLSGASSSGKAPVISLIDDDNGDTSQGQAVSGDDVVNHTLGGGEEVRLCNPCVPDPNPEPPRHYRPANESLLASNWAAGGARGNRHSFVPNDYSPISSVDPIVRQHSSSLPSSSRSHLGAVDRGRSVWIGFSPCIVAFMTT